MWQLSARHLVSEAQHEASAQHQEHPSLPTSHAGFQQTSHQHHGAAGLSQHSQDQEPGADENV